MHIHVHKQVPVTLLKLCRNSNFYYVTLICVGKKLADVLQEYFVQHSDNLIF
jgi:hypothetical protein